MGVVERASAAAALSDGAGAHSALFTELFVAVLELLKAKDVDQEVKECSIKCVSELFSFFSLTKVACTCLLRRRTARRLMLVV